MTQHLCIYGHFYQPPRENPFTGVIPIEPSATPFPNHNEQITAQCYKPNAESGNFAAISYDLGPTLASWLEIQHPAVYERIILSDRLHFQRYGTGNALAQGYNHTILPLAMTRDKQTQIAWGLADFRHRYGHEAQGMWLAETAVDLECLDLLAKNGVRYTVLAPWQAATDVDPSEPYIVRLREGRSIVVFFYNNRSGSVSFDQWLTINADTFLDGLASHWNQQKCQAGTPQLMILATDGEFYGHHQADRDKFLSYLVNTAAPNRGYEICTLERYLQLHPPTREVCIREPSAWSCAHGVARWHTGCSCTEGDSSWKPTLRQAMTNLATCGNTLFEQYAGQTLIDPWAARDDYLAVHNGWEEEESFWVRHSKQRMHGSDTQLVQRTRLLLEAQYYHQYSFTSCAFFFEALGRIEPRNAIAFARRAISLTWQATGIDLQHDFVRDLQAVKSGHTALTGAELYQQLPPVAQYLLPQSA